MNASTLQSLIIRNAQAITLRESVVNLLSEDAKHYYDGGNTEEFVSTAKHLRVERKKLAKLVELQKRLKIELKAEHGVGRIERMKVRIRDTTGFVYHADSGLTVAENLKRIYAAYEALVPKKADSRPAVEIA